MIISSYTCFNREKVCIQTTPAYTTMRKYYEMEEKLEKVKKV